MNRARFQPGVSLVEFLRRYGHEAACEQALAQARWLGGFVCPRCGARWAHAFARFGQAYWLGGACWARTSLRAGTLFAASKLPLTVWFLALYLPGQRNNAIAVLELRRHLGVCYRSAWRLKHKLMQAMTQDEADRRLGGVVQVDDAYLGGERTGGTPWRGSENKRPFVIAVTTDAAGRPPPVIEPVPAVSRAAPADWAAQHARTVVQAPPGKAGTEVAGTRWGNVVQGNTNRALDDIYHAFGFFKYAERYLAEAAWRFNHRFDLTILLPCLLATAAHVPALDRSGTCAMCRLTADAEAWR